MLTRGTVVTVNLEPTVGHEQYGIRPCVVVSDPEVAGEQRFRMVAVVPLTRTRGQGLLYPSVRPGPSGLRHESFALTDQVRSVDKRRIRAIGQPIRQEELGAIDTGLKMFLGLEEEELGDQR